MSDGLKIKGSLAVMLQKPEGTRLGQGVTLDPLQEEGSSTQQTLKEQLGLEYSNNEPIRFSTNGKENPEQTQQQQKLNETLSRLEDGQCAIINLNIASQYGHYIQVTKKNDCYIVTDSAANRGTLGFGASGSSSLCFTPDQAIAALNNSVLAVANAHNSQSKQIDFTAYFFNTTTKKPNVTLHGFFSRDMLFNIIPMIGAGLQWIGSKLPSLPSFLQRGSALDKVLTEEYTLFAQHFALKTPEQQSAIVKEYLSRCEKNPELNNNAKSRHLRNGLEDFINSNSKTIEPNLAAALKKLISSSSSEKAEETVSNACSTTAMYSTMTTEADRGAKRTAIQEAAKEQVEKQKIQPETVKQDNIEEHSNNKSNEESQEPTRPGTR